MITLEVELEEGCTAGLEGVLMSTVVELWLGMLVTINEEELLLAVLGCAVEELVCTLGVEVGTTTATVEEVVVVLSTAFPCTATSLAPHTFAFTRTSPTAFFK